MFGSIGGVFSALDLDFFLEKEAEEEIDLGSRFRIDEAEMVPRNRASVLASALLLGLIVKILESRERERESCTEFLKFEIEEDEGMDRYIEHRFLNFF